MPKHKLILENIFEDTNYALIAIHCSLDDYRLAYLLNKNLKTNLIRKNDLDYDYVSAYYSIFEWDDRDHQTTWSLVSNICRKESETLASTGSLFDNSGNAIKTFNLIPEYRATDYFLKINNESGFLKEKTILNSIQKIPQIVTAYTVEAANLKSKSNLIFN